MKKNKLHTKSRKLPPHSFEAHPSANAGEVKKPFVIAIIVVVAIISLSLLLLFTDQFVGKAYLPGAVNTGGIADDPNAIEGAVDVPVGATLATGEDGYSVTLEIDLSLALPNPLDCGYLDQTTPFESTLPWSGTASEIFEILSCNGNTLRFESSGFAPALNNQFTIGNLKFTNLAIGTYDLASVINILEITDPLDLVNAANLLTSFEGGIITVSAIDVPLTCGNIICEAGETNANCRSDCPVCGDGFCQGGPVENANNCAILLGGDCPVTCRDGYVSGSAVGGSETCDDLNSANGDGCSFSCQEESGWTCIGEPSVCNTICGDTIVVGTEECDDGNVVAGDGCSSTCVVESGYTCPTPGLACALTCGNGNLDTGEACDGSVGVGACPTGTTGTPVCAANCLSIDTSSCTATVSCGDGAVTGSEVCDGSVGVGACPTGTTGTPFCVACSSIDTSASYCTATVSCGDGNLDTGEACDDGDTTSGDGCSSTCVVETGYACTGEPSVCLSGACGDSILQIGEQCDNGDTNNGDGCSSTCQREDVDSDGVNDALDNCPNTATLNTLGSISISLGGGIPTTTLQHGGTSYIVQVSGSSGTGSGTIQFTVNGESTNQLRLGDSYVLSDSTAIVFESSLLTGITSVDVGVRLTDQTDTDQNGIGDACEVSTSCGDGVVEGTEQCDDGVTPSASGDGCSDQCLIELGYNCVGAPSVCSLAPLVPGIYSTIITAGTAGTPPLVVYTILLGPNTPSGANGPVLAIKTENLPALAGGGIYTVIVNYPDSAQVERKEILIYDLPVDQAQTIYGELEDSVTNPTITIAIQGTGITLR